MGLGTLIGVAAAFTILVLTARFAAMFTQSMTGRSGVAVLAGAAASCLLSAVAELAVAPWVVGDYKPDLNEALGRFVAAFLIGALVAMTAVAPLRRRL